MITSFWNLCRACPSMPVEKLHSEYRSTFQWHEYVGSHSNSVTAPVVRQPQQDHLSTLAGRPEEPSFPRRKKHPELAYRSSNGWLTKSSTTYEASLCPESRFTSISGVTASVGARGGGIGSSGPRKSISLGTIQAAGNIATVHAPKLSLKPEDREITLGGASSTGGITKTSEKTDNVLAPMTSSAPEGMSGFAESKVGGDEAGTYSGGYVLSQSTELKIHVARDGEQQPQQRAPSDEFKKKEYKSEYKKRFRPFSQYEYVDGKFFKKRGDHEIGDPWYKEVIELRKKAGEYKFRGWGTELGPQNIADAYHQHIWDQVSRRTSLAALALITTTPKSISKEEKDKENAKKSYPGKPTHARPHTATPKHPISDLEKSKHSDTVQNSKKKWEENRLQSRSTSRVKARSHSAGPAGRSPRKAIRQQSAASSVSEKDNSLGGWKVHLDSVQADKTPKPQQQRHPRPTTLATSPRPKASSGKGDRDPKLAKQQQFDKNSADPYLGYNEPVVKSPPEPTRVKSPEQVILRSPDPVNWTVPLDTTKSFTVTQNIREAPPSPRFRAGEKLHGELRNIHHHPASTHHSSAGSTMASSPISSFSTRSAPVPLSSSAGQPAVPISTSGHTPAPSTTPKVTATTTTTTAPPSSSSTASVVSQTTAAATTATATTTSTSSPSAAAARVGKTTTHSSLPEHQSKSTSGVLDRSVGSVGGGGKPDSSGAGPGTGDGSSSTSASSKPSQSSELEQKSSRSQAISGAVNGFDEKSATKSLHHKDKPAISSPPVKSSPQLHRAGVTGASKRSSTPSAERSKGVSSTGSTGSHEQSKTKSTTGATSTISGASTGLKCLDDPTFMFDPPANKPSVASSKSDSAKTLTKPAVDSSRPSRAITEQPKAGNKPEHSSRATSGTRVGEGKSSIKSSTAPKSTVGSKISDPKSTTKSPDVSKTVNKPHDRTAAGKSTETSKMLPKSEGKTSVISPKPATESPKSKLTESTKAPSVPSSKISEVSKATGKPVDTFKSIPAGTGGVLDSNKIAAVTAPSKQLVDSNKTTPNIPSKILEPVKQISTDSTKIREPIKQISTDSTKIREPVKQSSTDSPKIREPFKSIPSSLASKTSSDSVKSSPIGAPSNVTPPKNAVSKDAVKSTTEASKIPDMTKSVMAESSKIPEMTKSMLAQSTNSQQQQDGVKTASKIPEPAKSTPMETSKILEMTKSNMSEFTKIPEMTKSIIVTESSKLPEKTRTPETVRSGTAESKIPEMTRSTIGESKIPEMTRSTIGESKIPEMTRSIIGESKIPEMTRSIIGENKIPEMTRSTMGESKIPEMTRSTMGESKIPEMTRSAMGESKIPEMARSTMGASKIPEMTRPESKTGGSARSPFGESKIPETSRSTTSESKTPDFSRPSVSESKVPELHRSINSGDSKISELSSRSSMGDSKIPEMTRSIYAESSKIPEMTKSIMSESRIGDMSRSTYGEPSRIPQMMSSGHSEITNSGLPESSKIPEMTKSMLAESSRFPESSKSKASDPISKASDMTRSIYPEPTSKIPEPMKSTFDLCKIPEPMKPTFDLSRIPEPVKSYASDTSKSLDSPRPGLSGSGASKIPEPAKSATPMQQPPPVPARMSEGPKSGIPAPTKIPEPTKSSPMLPSKLPPYPAGSSSAIPGRTDTSIMSASTIGGLPSSQGMRFPPPPSSERPSSAKGALRVLEAPSSPDSATAPGDSSSSLKRKDFGFVPPAPVSIPKRTTGGISHVSETPPQAKGSGYRVLEAPDDPNEPSVSIVSPSSSRSRASDVLEKARHRFDKFWGKGKDDEK